LYIYFIYFCRGRRNSYTHTTLVKINDVNDKQSSEFYLGKKIAYIYRAKVEKNGSNLRAIWGKVMRRHGTNGVVRAKWSKNIPVSLLSLLVIN